MKNYLIALFALTTLITSCQDTSKTRTPEKTGLAETAEAGMQQHCYLYVKNRDTVSLTLNKEGIKHSGDLTYNLFEKDKNTGKVSGKMNGDTLLLDYTFNSEGTTSVRQVAFLKKGNQLIEGYGAAEEKDGKMVFKAIQNLDFSANGITLTKTDCL